MSDKIHERAQWKKLLFGSGIITSALCTITTVCCWRPFPLVPWGEGGYRTNPLDETVFLGSVSLSLLTVALAFFGRALPRFALISIGLLLFLLSVFGFVSNHV
jgi:hypothetical protein